MTDLQVFDEDYFLVVDDPKLGSSPARRVPAPNVANLPALAARMLPWRPLTAYTAGTFVSNAGKLYSVNADFTTGASFSTAGLTEAFAPSQTVRRYPAPLFFPGGGSMEAFSYAGSPYWRLNDTTVESIGALVPAQDLAGWNTATVIVRWYTLTSVAGNAYFAVYTKFVDDVSDVGAGYVTTTAGTVASAATGTLGIQKAQNMGTVTITANQDLALRVWRIADNVLDTLAVDMCFASLELQRAS